MNHQTITIHTTTPEGQALPDVDLLADLIDSVLKVPKMRTVSVRVDQIAASAERKFRVRNVDVLGTKPVSAAKPGNVAPHQFEPHPYDAFCAKCNQLEENKIHV